MAVRRISRSVGTGLHGILEGWCGWSAGLSPLPGRRFLLGDVFPRRRRLLPPCRGLKAVAPAGAVVLGTENIAAEKLGQHFSSRFVALPVASFNFVKNVALRRR